MWTLRNFCDPAVAAATVAAAAASVEPGVISLIAAFPSILLFVSYYIIECRLFVGIDVGVWRMRDGCGPGPERPVIIIGTCGTYNLSGDWLL